MSPKLIQRLLLTAALTFIAAGLLAASNGARGQRSLARPAAPATGPAVAASSQSGTSTLPASSVAPDYGRVVRQYCLGCHNQRSQTPAAHPLVLEGLDVNDIEAAPETWERVVRKLAVGAMPPQGLPRPEPAVLDGFLAHLVSSLDRAALRSPRPGEQVAHRLNRTEYQNAVRDLLDVEFNAVDMLPSDGGEFGFDNIASALKTSPLLLERYLAAALQVSTMAVGDESVAPGAATYPISREHSQRDRVEGLPLGTRGGILVRHTFPADGEYVLSGRLLRGVEEGLFGVEGWDRPNEFIITLDGEQIYSAPLGGPLDHEVNSNDHNRAKLVIEGRMTSRAFVTAGLHEVGFTWVAPVGQEQSVWMPALRDSQEVHMATGFPRLREVRIEGPYNTTGISDTPSRRRIFSCRPTSTDDELVCARRIVASLARRAFRRPVTPADIEGPMAFFSEARQEQGSFDAGIRSAIARILVSPSFLFRTERSPLTVAEGQAHRVTDVELASRLSFFLWNSIPDDDLLALAERGRLREPGVLQAQVRRMLNDRRVESMVASFAGQWLQLRSLESKVSPDLLLFPHFDDNVRKAFRKETELFFQSIVQEDRSVLDLLNADFTFVNERLARHYGIPGVYGERFRRVHVANPNRRGLLGHGSILSVTSVATRTSPVIRGKFILTALLGLPEPVPPPNVPALDESAPAAKPTSVRERVEMHRRNPVCASCHRAIDPLGFSLENFDAVGQWRDVTEDGRPVDASGVLQDGTSVDGPVALRRWLSEHPDVFVGNVAERLLIYAIGRGLMPEDMAVVRSIVRNAAPGEYKFHDVILGVVESVPFQMRSRPVPRSQTIAARE